MKREPCRNVILAAILMGGSGLGLVSLHAREHPGGPTSSLCPEGAEVCPPQAYRMTSSTRLGRWTIDAGGGTVGAASLSLSGTVGQPDAGSASSATFSLQSGFWHSSAGRGQIDGPIFRDGFESPVP